MNTFLSFKVKSSAGRFLALLVACACWLPSQGQQVKTSSPLQLAEQYYAAGEYYTAANLYEQHLNPSKANRKVVPFTVYAKKGRGGSAVKGMSRADILYKQAESYRLANYWIAADSTYKKCTENIDALYWQAVCKRSLGKYDEAEENLRKYLNTVGTNSPQKEAVDKELQTLQFIRKQLSRADSVLVNLKKLNTRDGYEKGAFAAVSVSGNQYLVSSTQTDPVQINGTNPHHSRIFTAVKNDDSLAQLTPIPLPSSAGPTDNQGAASISADGNHLYFSQWKKENGRTVSVIYYSVKQNGAWSQPVLLPQVNTNGFNSKQPFCSADGKYLFFSSDRPGGSGKFDIWYAPLKDDGTTGAPVNAGTVVNTANDEVAPFYQTSGNTLVFSTNGRQGMGGYDLFEATGRETTWTVPENMGHPVNSSRDDIYFFAPEKTALLANAVIGSDRGTGCCLETYNIKKIAKKKKLTGLVLDCKNSAPVPGATVTLTDASGNSRVTKTDSLGKYLFDTLSAAITDLTVHIHKQLFKDTTTAVNVKNVDETDLLTDLFFNFELCTDKKIVIKPETVVTVYFDFDKDVLKPEGVHKLDSLYKVLVETPTATLQISGYTDGKGTNEYNAKLSDRRARTCANFMIQKGIAAGRITFESFGECCPVEMELINGRDNAEGRSKNRRALINITKD